MDMKLTGSFGVSRRSDGVICIHVRDEESSTEFVEIKCSPEDFANAVTGLHGSPCTLDIRGLEKLGKTMETKEVYLESPGDEWLFTKWDRLPRKVKQDILDPLEVDGWKVEHYGSWGNMHKRFKDGYRAIARRWV